MFESLIRNIGDLSLGALAILGLLYVINRLGSLWISKWSEQIVPIQKQQTEALLAQVDCQREMVEVMRRTADLGPLIEELRRDRQQLGVTLRIMARKLELLETTDEEKNQVGA